ncbi:MAG: MoaD/ThiS family protein [Candidatus Methanofastidiosa archaeon]|nr:MoaD/ThiS family protein [Candidatus Methanofastidiosa archaeon]
MKVKVRYFARIREILGTDSETVDMAPGCTLGELVKAIEGGHGISLADYPLFFSINHEYKQLGTILDEGDEVALLFPPSGG